ncbi:MAG: hypothetical protein JSV88_10260 [Candidatus Aminicenantes bacterium]|nr:MAG: hypothetical protein JSV88_10260 [Candidatus Aminicenantes bacterium]
MKKIWNKYYERPAFLEGMTSLDLFGQTSSFKNPISKPGEFDEMASIAHSLSRYFSRVSGYLNRSMKIFSDQHVRTKQ